MGLKSAERASKAAVGGSEVDGKAYKDTVRGKWLAGRALESAGRALEPAGMPKKKGILSVFHVCNGARGHRPRTAPLPISRNNFFHSDNSKIKSFDFRFFPFMI